MVDIGFEYYSEEKYTRYVSELKNIEGKARGIVPQHSRCSIILENNLLMCKCLSQIAEWSPEQAEKKWNELASQFAIILQKTEVFGHENSTHDDLVPYLTLVFNSLYWTWINPKGISRKCCAVMESLGLVRKCLHFVLDFFLCPFINDSFNDVYLSVLHLMSLSSAHILTRPGVHNKLLLEIYFLVGHIILDSTQNRCDEELLRKFTNFVKTLEKFKTSFSCNSKIINSSGSKLSIFKFGLGRLNATADTPDVNIVLNGLGILECLCLLRLNHYDTSKEALVNLETVSEMSSLSGFLKGYVHMLLGDDEISLLFVQELSRHQIPEVLQYHCHLLMGIIFSKNKAYDKAHNEFLKAEELISRKLPTVIVIFYMAINYENWLKNSPSLNAISDAYLCSLKLVIRAARHAINEHSLSLSANYYCKTIQTLEPTPDVILGRALYMLARNYEIIGKFESSAKTFLKLFEMPNCASNQQKGFRVYFEPNPPTQTVLQEAITMLVKSKQFEKAKIVSNVSLNAKLQSAEDELIPYMFLAIIEGKLGNKTQELEFLKKCLAVDFKSRSMKAEINAESPSTFNKLIARVHLQKALDSVSKRHFNAATTYFKMALGSNIHDKRVLYQYFRFLIKSRDMNRFELWISHKNTLNKKEERYSNLALQYLLESNITDVKIEAISAHFWASEVFDDF